MEKFELTHDDFESEAVSPFVELGAYEALWDEKNASFKNIAKKFATSPGSLPSDFVGPGKCQAYANDVHAILRESGVTDYGIRVHGAGEYPRRLRDAEHPIELLYYRGWWEIANSPNCVAVVGTRSPTEEGARRTRRLVRSLLSDGFTITSGLARGIDSVAHSTAIEEGGLTIAVIGTPLNHVYPKENQSLQEEISNKHLLISQVPVKRYEDIKNPTAHRHFFPARNITMSALTQATIIVEAGETSGTLVQAKAALKQGRKLFILDNCFRNNSLTWPHDFAKQGAIRVYEYDDIRRELLSRATH